MEKMKLKMLILAVAVIVITLLTQTTLAYYTTVGKATNVVTSGNIQLQIHERTADGKPFPKEGFPVIPGDIVGKRVTIENICDHPFYLRVKLIKGSDSEELSAEDAIQILDPNNRDWFAHSDGYIYYKKILRPGVATSPVFTKVEIVGDQVTQNDAGSALTLTVKAFAVQSQNNPARYPWEASGWPEG